MKTRVRMGNQADTDECAAPEQYPHAHAKLRRLFQSDRTTKESEQRYEHVCGQAIKRYRNAKPLAVFGLSDDVTS
jgi:hypothetical protein